MKSAQTGDARSHLIELKPLTIPVGWLIAPRSYLVDRIAAKVEQVCLVESRTGGGSVDIQMGSHVFEVVKKKKLPGLRRAPQPIHFDGPGLLIDLRQNSPENWAHFLTNHLAFLALACRTLDKHWSAFTAILPEESPSYLRNLVALIDLPVLYTNAPVHGEGVHYTFDRWNVIRGERGPLLRNPAFNPLAAYLETMPPLSQDEAPKRLFVSRKNTRALKNEDHVEETLNGFGFTKIYPEDLEVGLQIRTILNADVIVGVHGAALAPILYNAPQTPHKKIIELFPVGHITDVYRAAAAECKMAWCGVRGHIEPENLNEIYALDRPYIKHSLNDFRIDTASIETALGSLGIR